MSMKETLKKVAGPLLAEKGFRFLKVESSVRWVFARQVGEIEQYIVFQKSNYASALRIDFSTSLNISERVSGHRFVGRNVYFWEYNDEDSLIVVIRELTDIAINYGIPCLDLMIIPDLVAGRQLREELYENYFDRAKEFARIYELDFKDPIVKIQKVEEILLNRKAEVQDVDWELILNASAYFGELVRNNLGGNWAWREQIDDCVIDKVGGKENTGTIPLKNVAMFWGKPNMIGYSLINRYNALK